MKDFVWSRWGGVIAWVASTSVAWLTLAPSGLFRTAFAWVTLLGFVVLASIALWQQTRPDRSTRYIDDVEPEPARVAPARPARVALSRPQR